MADIYLTCAMLVCAKCHASPEQMAHYATRTRVCAMVSCHGDVCRLVITKANLYQAQETGAKLVVFAEDPIPEPALDSSKITKRLQLTSQPLAIEDSHDPS